MAKSLSWVAFYRCFGKLIIKRSLLISVVTSNLVTTLAQSACVLGVGECWWLLVNRSFIIILTSCYIVGGLYLPSLYCHKVMTLLRYSLADYDLQRAVCLSFWQVTLSSLSLLSLFVFFSVSSLSPISLLSPFSLPSLSPLSLLSLLSLFSISSLSLLPLFSLLYLFSLSSLSLLSFFSVISSLWSLVTLKEG